MEDRDDALTKAREAAHKAQLQKYQVCLAHGYTVMSQTSTAYHNVDVSNSVLSLSTKRMGTCYLIYNHNCGLW